MKKMQSSSSNSGRSNDDKRTPKSNMTSPFSKVFSYSLLAFFSLQVIVGTAVIVFFIGGEMSRMQEANVKSELNGRSQRLVSYVNDRLLMLGDYAKLPVIIAGVMHPGDQLANTVDLIESLPFLKSDVLFELKDFQGATVYSKWEGDAGGGFASFQQLMDGQLPWSVQIVHQTNLNELSFWKLSVPVRYHGLSEGILSAYFPIKLKEIYPEDKENVRIVLSAYGAVVSSIGEIAEPSIALESPTGFSEIVLQQAVSKQVVNQRVEYLVYVMLIALVAGTALVMIVVRRLGHTFFLVPHERLQEMSDELEKDVEKRTEDLKMRTVQLSIEIRERREAELEAQETGNLVSALLEGIGAAFFIVNPETGTIIRTNSVVHDMFGLSPWQIDNRSCNDVFSGFSDSMSQLFCLSLDDAERYEEGVAHHTNGSQFPVSRYLVPMEVQGERHIGVIMLDITDRKNLERRLNMAQKLESVGELASGIAHEINTPIQYVGDSIRFVEDAIQDLFEILHAKGELLDLYKGKGEYPELVQRIEELEEDADLEFIVEEIPKACKRALDGTERVASIVRAMKNFAHPGTGEMSMVDINQALENTIVVSKNEWKYVADIVQDFNSVPMVKCLPGDINQVLLNTVVNAAHAIGDVVGDSNDKGTITLSTAASDHDLIIRIADTGTGIPENIREKVFDPFFTTKEVGKGSGQGLAIVHDIIVERHGGTIDIESEVGKGTTFIITLPLSRE